MTMQAPTPEFTRKCKEAEFFETDPWVARRILDVELMTHRVLDPCAGRGILGQAAFSKGYDVTEFDLHDWPDKLPGAHIRAGFDYLASLGAVLHEVRTHVSGEFTVFMNPPFSKTVAFVERSMALGARKIILFQRLAFLESSGRRDFFERHCPARIWLCGDRATCWRGDVPAVDVLREEDGEMIKGRKGRSAPTPHAFFVWERGHRGAGAIHHLYKDE